MNYEFYLVDDKVCDGEGQNGETDVEPAETVAFMVEEDAAADVQQYADHQSDNHLLLFLVRLNDVEVDERTGGRHGTKERQQHQHFPEAHAVGNKESHQYQRHRDVMDDDAPDEALVHCTVGLH